MIFWLLDEAMGSGARQATACHTLGLDRRTVQRWKKEGGSQDKREGSRRVPKNKLSGRERKLVLDVANQPAYRDCSPKQIVPRLADGGKYIASESTFYRVLREAQQLTHREPSRPRCHHKPHEYVTYGPGEVWTWDITYLRSAVRGMFFYLYMVVDIWSRKIVGWSVEEAESMEHGAELIESICIEEGIDPNSLVLHSDNGGPMKGSTMLATLQRLGIVASFSRPRVSDDNPYSEALFRTLKYRPWYPSRPFEDIEEARCWVSAFVNWYNHEHFHSAIGFVTPADRHKNLDSAILANRRIVYEEARQRHPERWSGNTRNWRRTEKVVLNPNSSVEVQEDTTAKVA